MRRKGKIIITIVIGIVCFLLVMITSMQFKVVYQTDITSIDNMRKEELEEELASWKTKYNEAEEKYEEVSNTLNKYNEESNSDTETKKNLEEELENLNLMLGKTDVEGKGIIIILNDENEKIDAWNLMLIVNYLKDAGAEAISINDQRIVDTTCIVDFTDGNYSYCKINDEKVRVPYVIKAIGEPEYLKGNLIEYVKNIRENYNVEVNIEEKNKIEISAYSGDFNTKYIEEN